MHASNLRSWIGGAAMLSALALPGAVVAKDADSGEQYVCSGRAEGALEEAVEVMVFVNRDGTWDGTPFGNWNPPLLDETQTASFDESNSDVSLTVGFDDASPGGIGRLEDGFIMLMAFPPPRKRVSTRNLQARLDGYLVEVRYDGGDIQKIAMAYDPEVPDEDGPDASATQFGDLRLSAPLPETIEIAVKSKQHKSLAKVRYRLNALGSREALLAEAWSKAQAAIADPTSCKPSK